MNINKTKKFFNFPLEKYPGIPRNAFILSIFIFILSIIFPVGKFGDTIDILLISLRLSCTGTAVV